MGYMRNLERTVVMANLRQIIRAILGPGSGLDPVPVAPVVTVDALATNDDNPELTGTIDDTTSAVSVSIGGYPTFYPAVNNGDNTWTLAQGSLGTPLPDGTYNVIAFAVPADSARPTGADSTSNELIIKATPPTVTITPKTTADTSPALSGTVNEPFATVQVTVNGNPYAATNNGDGTWVLAQGTITPALGDGTYSVTVAATDSYGNVGTDATSNELVVDSTAPTVAITPLTTMDTSPALAGTVSDPAATIDVAVDGSNYAATNNGDGTWSLAQGTITPALAVGTYDVVVTATDALLNEGTDGTTNELVIQAVTPVPAAAFTPHQFEMTDDFSTANIKDAAHELDFYKTYAGLGSITHSGGLNLTSPATRPANNYEDRCFKRTRLESRLNKYLQPLEIEHNGFALSYAGTQKYAQVVNLYLTDQDTLDLSQFPGKTAAQLEYGTNGFYYSNSAFLLQITGTGTFPKFRVFAKEDTPDSTGTEILAWETLTFFPLRIRMQMDAKTFRIVFTSAAGVERVVTGAHGLTDAASWGYRGDAYYTMELNHGESATEDQAVTAHFDSVAFRSLRHFDVFEETVPTNTGFADDFYTASGNSLFQPDKASGRRFRAAASGAKARTFIGTHVSKAYNFFTQELRATAVFSLGGDTAAGNARLAAAFSAETADPYAARYAVMMTVDGNSTVRLSRKVNEANVLPEDATASEAIGEKPSVTGGVFATLNASGRTAVAAELILNYRNYNLTVYYSDGSDETTGLLQHGLSPWNWGEIVNSGSGRINNNGDSAISFGAIRNSVDLTTTEAVFTSFIVERTTPIYIASTVFGPVGDGYTMEIPPIHADQVDVDKGIIYATLAPFNMDPNEVEDSAPIAQQINDFCMEWGLTPFVSPAGGGRFRFSYMPQAIQPFWYRTDAHVNNNYSPGNMQSPNDMMPLHWRGHPTNRPVFVLDDGAYGYDSTDEALRKNFFDFWSRKLVTNEPWKVQPNTSMSQEFSDIDIEVGTGNPGAAALHLQGAQSSGPTNVKVTLLSGDVCFEGGSGSGGYSYGVEAYGGRIGMRMAGTQDYFRQVTPQPAQEGPVVSGFKCSGQTVAGITYQGQSTLTVMGAEVSMNLGVPLIQVPNQSFAYLADRGMVVLKDAIVEFPSYDPNNAVIDTVQAVIIENVYVRNGGKLINWLSNTPSPPAIEYLGEGWYYIPFYAAGVQWPNKNGNQHTTPVVVGTNPTDLVRAGRTYTYGTIGPSAAPTPGEMWGKYVHTLPHVLDGDAVWYVPPSEDARKGIVNIADHFAAFLVGKTKVAVPKMAAWVDTVNDVSVACQIDGVSRAYAGPIPRYGTTGKTGDFTTGLVPLWRLPDTESASKTILRNLNFWAPVEHPHVEAITSRAKNTLVHNCNIMVDQVTGFGITPAKRVPTFDNKKLARFIGSRYGGDGHFTGQVFGLRNGRDYYQGADSTVMTFDRVGNDGLCQIISANAEHMKSHGAIEFIDCGGFGVDVLGDKTEGMFVVFRLRALNGVGSCEKVRIYAIGGNATPLRFDHDPNTKYGVDPLEGPNLTDYPDRLGGTNGKGVSPNYTEYPVGGGGSIVRADEDVRNWLLAMTMLQDDFATESGDPRGVFGRHYVPRTFQKIWYGDWRSIAGQAQSPPTVEAESPVAMVVGDPWA